MTKNICQGYLRTSRYVNDPVPVGYDVITSQTIVKSSAPNLGVVTALLI